MREDSTSHKTSAKSEAPRDPILDVMRGLAALVVTIFHLNEPLPYISNIYRDTVKYGSLGVPVFFILSGYVVHAAALRSKSINDYLWRRGTRIYPPYWASILLVGLVCLARKLATGSNDRAIWPYDLQGWIATITAMTSPATSTPGVNWVYWTLPFEIAFYATTMIVIISRRAFLFIAIGLTVLGLWKTQPNGFVPIPGLFFISHWPLFGLGVGLSILSIGSRSSAVVVLLACAAATTIQFPLPVWIIALLTMAGIWFGKGRTIAGIEPLVRLGKISYSLYLIHVPIGCYLLLQWKTDEWSAVPILNCVYDLGVTIVCIVVAYLFYLVFELPSIRLGGIWRRRAVLVNRSCDY